MKSAAVTLLVLTLVLVAPLSATTLSFDFSNPPGPLSTSQTYASNGVLVTAFRFNGTSPTNLLVFTLQGTTGLGIPYLSGSYLQLDLSQLWALSPTSVAMSIFSPFAGRTWSLFGTNQSGSLGTLLMSGTASGSFLLPTNAANYQFLSLRAAQGDELLTELTATTPVPEPGSLILLGSGLMGLAGVIRRKLSS